MDDRELLRRHVAGDPDAFGTLFARHRDRLWAVAARTLADPQDAADALQEAMISAFRRAGSFRGESAVTTWLHRIVVNSCLDRMRRQAVRPAVGSPDEQFLDRMAQGGGAVDPSAAADIALDVRTALRRLPRDQQAALVLVDMLGYSVAEAAQILRTSEGTVKSRCARGRARLLPRLAYLRQRGPAGQRSRSSGRGSDPPASGEGPRDPGPAGRDPGTPGPVKPEPQPRPPDRAESAGLPPATARAPGRGTHKTGRALPGSRNRLPAPSVLPAQEGGGDAR